MIPYIIHVALILAGCLLFYKLLLQKETFYRLNRIVLLVCLLLSFSLPLLPVPEQWSFRSAEQPVGVSITDAVFTTAAPAPAAAPAVAPETTSAKNAAGPTRLQQAATWVWYLYWFGVLVFGLTFLFQVGMLLFRAYTRPVIRDGRYRI